MLLHPFLVPVQHLGSVSSAGRPGEEEDAEDAVSDAGATFASSTVPYGDAVSVVDSVVAGGPHAAVVGVPGSLATLKPGNEVRG